MKKQVAFLITILTIAVMLVAMLVAGAIYQTGNKMTVVPYFFQRNNLPVGRPGVPASPDDLGANAKDYQNSKMYQRLLERYVTELFYVTPDTTALETRKDPRTSPLRHMSTSKVFNQWLDIIAPEITEMVNNKVLRTVKLVAIEDVPGIDDDIEYKKVEYELKTWTKPNDMNAVPEVSRGVVYLQVVYNPGLRQEMQQSTGMSITKYLEKGRDPAGAFRFGVTDISIPQAD